MNNNKLQMAAYEFGQLKSVMDLFAICDGDVQVICTFANDNIRVENIHLDIPKDDLLKYIADRMSDLSNLFKDF